MYGHFIGTKGTGHNNYGVNVHVREVTVMQGAIHGLNTGTLVNKYLFDAPL